MCLFTVHYIYYLFPMSKFAALISLSCSEDAISDYLTSPPISSISSSLFIFIYFCCGRRSLQGV